MKQVYLVTMPEAFASGVYGARDIFLLDESMLAALDGGGRENTAAFHAELVGSDRDVETVFGPSLPMDRTFEETRQADIVYLPPLILLPEAIPEFDSGMLSWLRQQYEGGALICAACTGTFVLGASGLLDGEPATTHWAFGEAFAAAYPNVDLRSDRTLLVGGEDKRLVTAGAYASWYDLMLYLIHRYCGSALARRVSKMMLLDWHDVDQNAYSTFRDNREHSDTVIRDAQDFLLENLSQPHPVDCAIKRSGLAQRSFHRRFKQATDYTPIRYVQLARVERAKEILEDSEKTVENTAWQVGYEDPAYFRSLFKRVTGVTPTAYRKLFRTPPNVAHMLP